jgi:hypothetical protein
MLDGQRPEQAMDDGGGADAGPASVALVPLTSARWSPVPNRILLRSSPTFVTHLIATAEHAPQTRGFRRATPADAQTAYGAQRHSRSGSGIRTHRTV